MSRQNVTSSRIFVPRRKEICISCSRAENSNSYTHSFFQSNTRGEGEIISLESNDDDRLLDFSKRKIQNQQHSTAPLRSINTPSLLLLLLVWSQQWLTLHRHTTTSNTNYVAQFIQLYIDRRNCGIYRNRRTYSTRSIYLRTPMCSRCLYV